MKKALSILTCIVLILSTAACSGDNTSSATESKEDTAVSKSSSSTVSQVESTAEKSESESEAEKAPVGGGSLSVYSTIYDEEYNMLMDAFVEKYGVTIELVQGGAGELKTRIEAEAANPQGDVMFGGLQYPDVIGDNADMWEDYVAVGDAELPEEYRNTTGNITYYTTQVVNLLVNKELAAELGVEIKGYEDLLQPELKGKIVSCDPSGSSSAWRQLSTMLVVMGEGDYEAGWTYVEELVKNLDGVMTSSSSAVYKGVFEGEYVVGLTYEAPCVTYLQDGFGDKVEIVYMEEGTTSSPFGSAIIKDAKNMDNAKLFMDFLVSDEGQAIYASSAARHIKLSLPTTNEFILPLTDIKVIPEDVDYLASNQTEILDRFAKLWAQNS